MTDSTDPGILAALRHVRANLASDLSLENLASVAGLSPAHFHRKFRSLVGETTAKYVERLRLEAAALKLILFDETVLAIALDCGYRSHETFARAFRRHFGSSPREYRTRRQAAIEAPAAPTRSADDVPGDYTLSTTRFRRIAAIDIATIRHIGPYEHVPDTLWATLVEWREQSEQAGKPILLGIAHDAPGIAEPGRMRFDAAVQVPGPFETTGPIVHDTLPTGLYAVTTHVGPYTTLPDAYAQVVARVMHRRGVRLLGVPTVEVYRAVDICQDDRNAHTEICLPVDMRRSGRRAR